MATNNNQQFIEDMQAMLDFLKAHPDYPRIGPGYTTVSFLAAVNTKAEFAEAARLLGHADKGYDEMFADLSRKFGTIRLGAYVKRDQVCRRIVIGKKILPAEPARPEREVDDVKWECGNILEGIEDNATPSADEI